MTITTKATSTRIRAISTLVAKLDALPLAVAEIHKAIDLGTADQGRRGGSGAEDAGIRSIGDHSDPTGDAAIANVGAYERHLADVEDNLATLALAAGNLCDIVGRWVVSAANAEDHPRCHGGGGVEEWTRPDCTEWVSYNVRDDGSLSYRNDGLCNACRVRKHRHDKLLGAA